MTFASGNKQRGGATAAWNCDFDTDLRRLRDDYKTDLLVSLIEEHMFVELQIPHLRDGMEKLWFPIQDQSLPESQELFCEAVQHIVETVRQGKTAVIHCKGGFRTARPGRRGSFGSDDVPNPTYSSFHL